MKNRDFSDLGLDKKRRHGKTEVLLVAAVFRCSVETARKILRAKPSRAKLAEVRGMMDAASSDLQCCGI